MYSRRLGGPKQRAEVLRILERIQDENEWWLLSLDRAREQVVQAGELPSVRDQRDPLMAVETRQRG